MNYSEAVVKSNVEMNVDAMFVSSAIGSIEHPSVSMFKALASERKCEKLYRKLEKRINFIDYNVISFSKNMTRSEIDMYIDHVNYKKAIYRVAIKRMFFGAAVASLSVASILTIVLCVAF